MSISKEQEIIDLQAQFFKLTSLIKVEFLKEEIRNIDQDSLRQIKNYVVKHRRDQFGEKIVNAVPQTNKKVLAIHVSKVLLKNRSILMAA